jgi:hypothetical protein
MIVATEHNAVDLLVPKNGVARRSKPRARPHSAVASGRLAVGHR